MSMETPSHRTELAGLTAVKLGTDPTRAPGWSNRVRLLHVACSDTPGARSRTMQELLRHQGSVLTFNASHFRWRVSTYMHMYRAVYQKLA